jgi:thiamine biosynthesis lipoprotein
MEKTVDSVIRARPLLGTFVEITAWGSDGRQLESAVDAAFASIERVHGLMSYHEPNSDVSRLNRANAGAPVVIHEWTAAVLKASIDLQHRSNGLFNIAVGAALERLGLLPSSASPSAHASDVGQRAVELLPGHCARWLAPGNAIDLGGIAKGFAVDQAVAVLRLSGAVGGVVNAGGDLFAFGPDERVVGIRDPRNPARLMSLTKLRQAALASTALGFDPMTTDQASLSSIIDPRSGEPVLTMSGATVRAPSCMIADALTKVIMIGGQDASGVLEHYGASGLFMTRNGDVLATADWEDVHSLAA